nr:epidermal growth factor receptor substrate 15-like [Oncorhynchus nerka]
MEREMEWERETSALQGQPGLAREELHSAILRRQAQQQKEELFGELQREVDRLKNGREEMRKKLCGREEELKRLRDEQHQLKDKLAQKEEMVVALRVKLQDHEEDARVLRQQLLSSQDAL